LGKDGENMGKVLSLQQQIINIMATIKFLTKGKGESSSIYLRFRDGQKTDITALTGYSINSDHWNNKSGEPKQIAANQDKLNLSENLNDMQSHIRKALNRDKGSGVTINKNWLIHEIALFKNPSLDSKVILLSDMLRKYQDKLKFKNNPKTEKSYSPLTIKNFNTTLSRLAKYEEFKKTQFHIHQIDLTFHEEYQKFASEELGLSINSIGKDLRQIKTVCLDARDYGFDINRQIEYKKFNAPSEKTTFVTLTKNEIQRIKDHQFKQDYLRNAQDWLIIGCWTGCRVGDLMNLTKSNLRVNTKGQKFIRYTQSKTGKQVDLSIHDHVDEVLERLGDFPRPISDVNFNKYIKTVCREAGLTYSVTGTRQNPSTHKKESGNFEKWELVKSHTCRRSFATNHYDKLSNKAIMKATGHATERMLLAYIGETEQDHLDEFIDVWNKNKETTKNNLKIAL
jgi:integrase